MLRTSTMSPKSPTPSDNSLPLSPLNEEQLSEKSSDSETEVTVEMRQHKSDRRRSDERAVRHSIMISRSMEDLSHLADEEDAMAMAMHQDTFQMGLMSLRTPVE